MNQICQKTLKETLKYDPLTGHFTWIKAISDKIKTGKRAGYTAPNGYRFIRINKKKAVRQQANITYNFHPNHGT